MANRSIPSTNQYLHGAKQAKRLLLKFLGRWLITAALCGAHAGTIKAYDRRAYLEGNTTNIYNAIAAALTITLSLNLEASLNGFAAAIKWVILAHGPFLPEVSDLLLGFDSSKVNAIKLLWYGRWGLRSICILWLLLVLGAQVGTALIGLTYGVSPLSGDKGEVPRIIGDGATSIFTNIGFRQVATYPFVYEDTMYSLTSQRSTAFAYGIGALGSDVINLLPEDDFSSYFRSVTFDIESRNYINAVSNYPLWGIYSLTQWNVCARYVQSYANCELLNITNRTTSSDETAITFEVHNGIHVFIIPMANLDYTIYISDTNHTCGARCTQVYVIFSADNNTDLFRCNNTVGLMYNYGTTETADEPLSIPNTQARILAGAIGWGNLDINSFLNGVPAIGRFQGSSFPNESYWAPLTRPDERIMSDYFIARFTSAAIAVYDQYGPWREFSDIVIPGQASQLDVMWNYTILVLVLIPGLQAVLALTTIWAVYHYQVPVRDNSPFAMATLLRPIIPDAAVGSLKNGKEIAKTINGSVIYTFNGDDGSGHYRVEAMIISEGNGPGRKRFPSGPYR
ncbi:hypothetical protein O1611_g3987 [Lasiodiplodia mahajangana]|uniref:Uncharacterized protein n=1 Tax=Lasiodiplodia mahajangana TaxID=1108764 RepID=A0ACC2JQI9_9PEZI|nr:hypothetical protein O1611_g3987 [Lasiodiplodia mahajangana]